VIRRQGTRQKSGRKLAIRPPILVYDKNRGLTQNKRRLTQKISAYVSVKSA